MQKKKRAKRFRFIGSAIGIISIVLLLIPFMKTLNQSVSLILFIFGFIGAAISFFLIFFLGDEKFISTYKNNKVSKEILDRFDKPHKG